MTEQSSQFEEATLGGGCFWCIEAVFKEMDGVVDVESGYAGGARPDPTYAQVCSGATGHAEVVRLRFDPKRVGYREILTLFFIAHDPTQLNRQGHDVGSQYRSVIFHHDDTQARIAREMIAELEASGRYPGRIVTEVAPLTSYYPAEAGHQDYFEQHPDQPYCQVVVAPKLQKARQWLARKG
jgi:peptide-methionine (S)-S-oxide reductase